ncbi:MAG: hypothetical protein QM766_28620 [Burkholderiaceae bacterium]
MNIPPWAPAALLAVLPAIAFAQLGPSREAPLPTIGLSVESTDDAGLEVVAKLREAIKRAGYFPSTNAPDALVGLHFLSVDPRTDEQGRGQQTLYSVAWTGRDGRFVTHTVATCTLRSATDCANALMVTTSQIAQMQQAREASERPPR